MTSEVVGPQNTQGKGQDQVLASQRAHIDRTDRGLLRMVADLDMIVDLIHEKQDEAGSAALELVPSEEQLQAGISYTLEPEYAHGLLTIIYDYGRARQPRDSALLSAHLKPEALEEVLEDLPLAVETVGIRCLMLAARRNTAVDIITEKKRKLDMPPHQQGRFDAMMTERLQWGLELGLEPEFVNRFFAFIHERSLVRQERRLRMPADPQKLKFL